MTPPAVAARFFEDVSVGDRWVSPGYTFTEGDVVDFALRYDPQPFHIDRAHAETESIYGGLIASGFHTLAICFRLVHMTGVFAGSNIGGRGLDELRWPRAVRPGDTVRVAFEVLEARTSSRPDRGNVTVAWTATNQEGETVLTARLLHVLARRPQARDNTP